MSSKSASTATSTGSNWIETSRAFVDDVWAERKKVRWPDFQETQKSTVAVLIVTAIVAVVLGIVDWGLSLIMAQVFS